MRELLWYHKKRKPPTRHEHSDAKQIQMGTAKYVALQKCEAVDMFFRYAIPPLAICKRREQRHNRDISR